MSAVVEQRVRAHLVTDEPDGHRAVRVALRYDPDTPAPSIRIAVPGAPGEQEWTLPREVLEQGLRTPVRSGDVRVWPCGRVQVVLEFRTEGGVTVLQFDCTLLVRFLRRTYAARTAAAPS